MNRLVAMSNQKGGVGKTTTCISLGSCLAEAGYRVLLVDLDSQSNLTMSVGLDPDELEWTLPDLLSPDAEEATPPIQHVVRPTGQEGLSILPSDLRMASTEREFYTREGYEHSLTTLLKPLDQEYDFTLFDCPPSLGGMTLAALTGSHFVLIPVQCEFYAARGLVRLIEIINFIRERSNPGLEYGLVASLYDQRNSISRRVLDNLRENFPDQLYSTIISIDTRLRESAVAGEPITTFAPKSRSSEQYHQLASELLDDPRVTGVKS